MTDDNPFREQAFLLDPKDVPMVYQAGVTRVAPETEALFNVSPEGRPCTTLTVAAIQVIDFGPIPTGQKITSVMLFSIEALAALDASAAMERELWSAADRTRYQWLYDQHQAAARAAKAHRNPNPGEEQ
jgi:hypothetical protein